MNLIETSDHEINGYGCPYLGFYCVFGRAIEGLDSEVLLDPFEEQFDVPSTLVDACDGDGRQASVVGEEDETLAGFGIDEADAPQLFGVVAFALGGLQADALIAAQADALVDRSGLADVESQVAFGSGDEEGTGLVDAIESPKIDVTTIHYIDASGLESDLVEDVHVVDASVCNADEYRDGASQVHHRVQFDRRFGGPEMRPGEQRQAQVDGRGIQGINHLLEIQPVAVARVKSSRPADQNLGQVGVNPPVPMLVGVGQIGARDLAPKPHGIKMPTSAQARLDVPQTLPESHLRKRHRKELIPRREAPALPRHRVALDAALKLFAIQGVCYLGENRPAFVHSLLRMNRPKYRQAFQMRDTLDFA